MDLLVLWKIQSGHDSVHRRIDGRIDGHPPFNFVEAEGGGGGGGGGYEFNHPFLNGFITYSHYIRFSITGYLFPLHIKSAQWLS